MSEAASTTTAATTRYPCVCCGHLTLTAPPGSYDDCPVCGWEDDIVGLRWPDLDGGANRLSLIEAQRSYAATGAAELGPRGIGKVMGVVTPQTKGKADGGVVAAEVRRQLA